jgi:uncharacterized membrane protein
MNHLNHGRFLYLRVGLVSACVLAFETGPARFFSVMFEYHYSFLLISIAVLGVGLGGLVAHLASTGTAGTGARPHILAERWPLLMSLSLVIMLFALLYAPPARSVPGRAAKCCSGSSWA